MKSVHEPVRECISCGQKFLKHQLVRVVKNDADGVFPVVDEYRDAAEFPYSVSVTGRGSGTVTCYVNDVEQWSQNVNFAG